MEAHERERFVDGAAGDRLGHAHRLSGIDAPGDGRPDRRGVERDAVVVRRATIRRDGSPPGDRAIEHLARRRVGPAAQELKCRVVGVDVAGARAAFNRHVADRHALVDGHRVDRAAAVLVREADAPVDAEAADDREDHILGVHARRQGSVDFDPPHFQRIECQALRGQDVANLRGADAEGERAERAVRRRVAVAARDRHARLRQAELRSDHVHDALVVAVERPQGDARFTAVAFERRGHFLGHQIKEGPRARAGRHDVVDGPERAVRVCDIPPLLPEHVEGLRGGHFVDQVQADEQLRLSARQFPHGVRVPDFAEKSFSHGAQLQYSHVSTASSLFRFRGRTSHGGAFLDPRPRARLESNQNLLVPVYAAGNRPRSQS